MERLKELQRSGGGVPHPMYHPEAEGPEPRPEGPHNADPSMRPPDGRIFNKRPKRKRTFSELPWSDYFTERQFIEVGRDKFCVYTAGSGPTVLCLHGGGHSSLSWAIFTSELIQRASVRVLAIDQRGHGDTVTEDDSDLSAETLTSDVERVWSALYPQPEDRPPVLLMGHSMGGAVAIRVSSQRVLPNIRGVVVIDVVEGSAMDALSAMQGVLKRRPQHFPSKKHAVEWALKSGQLRNNESARVSVGGQLREMRGEEIRITTPHVQDTLQEEEEEEEKAEEAETTGGYTWKVDLCASEKYWSGWYTGISQLFLSVPAPKLLLLAGPDRLDTELTLAHMQGKFQLQMFNHTGHSIHEDLPDSVADVVTSFLVRQRIAQGRDNPQTIRPCC